MFAKLQRLRVTRMEMLGTIPLPGLQWEGR